MADDDDADHVGQPAGSALRPWQLLREESGPQMPLFRPRYDILRNPRNGRELRGLVLSSGDWVNCVAVTAEQQLVMVRQYRVGIRAATLETPGGMVDPGEAHGAAARRELLEETGYGGGRWRYLGAVEPNPAIHDHLCHHWLAEDVERVSEQNLGGGEDILVCVLGIDAVRQAIAAGELRHVLALSALTRVYRLWD